MRDVVITSPANPRLREVVSLRRRRIRDARRLTLVEGYEEVTLALDAGAAPDELYWCPELVHAGVDPQTLADRVRDVGGRCVQLSRAAFDKIAYRESPDGVLAVVPTADRSLRDLDALLDDPRAVAGADPREGPGARSPHAPLVLVCQGVEKPGNLGAMLRTADGAGVAAVLAADPVTDWGNPNLVRASKGTVFSVPVAADSASACAGWLRRRGIELVALTPAGARGYADIDYTGPVALAVGAEKTGLTDDILAAATLRAVIPMAGHADSLNVAASAAIVLYEAVRQRRIS